ncbi:unnamed protein product [Urochloa decumbens]|uniref:BHLH domain-containing protein n=1 Tax=Urochloa decumbens TaxID=240449 RepID=A0ABC8Z827_9POAL
MYHPQCELLMAHETRDLDAGHQPHLTAAAGVASIPSELSFHLLHSLDAAAVTPQPTIDYFFGGGDSHGQPAAVQYEPLVAAGHQHTMSMLRDYCNGGGHYAASAEPFLRGARSGALVFGGGTTDDESAAAYMPGPFETSPPPRATGGRKRSRAAMLGAGAGGFHGGPANGVEKKEKQRRQRLTEKYTALMFLIPNRTKDDRATVISDAIEYIQELGRTVEELTLLVEKKRRRMELQGDVVDAAPAAVVPTAAAGEAESSEGEVAPPPAVAAAAAAQRQQPIRSTYIQRRSKDTSVDVRIVEDDVNIKLTKRRRDGCLAAASRALDDLRLDLVHLSGGKIGDCHIYMFNTKIHPRSPVFASAVASRLMEVVDEN